MHVKHEAAKGCSEVVREVLIRHTAQNKINIQLARDFIDSQVLAVQTHPCKEVKLIPEKNQQKARASEISQYEGRHRAE